VTFKQAKELSILKWKWIIKNPPRINGDKYKYANKTSKANPKLKDLNSQCGFCEKYAVSWNDCPECPLYRKWGKTCYIMDSLFQQWLKPSCNKESKDSAKQILRDIEECEE